MSIALQTQLTTLDLASNFITTIENVSHLTQLEELWVRFFRWTAFISSYITSDQWKPNTRSISTRHRIEVNNNAENVISRDESLSRE